MAAKECLAQGRCGHLRPFLPARPTIRQAANPAVRCAASGEDGRKAEALDRRAALLGLLGLGLGLAADAQAASNPLAQKKDPYTVGMLFLTFFIAMYCRVLYLNYTCYIVHSLRP